MIVSLSFIGGTYIYKTQLTYKNKAQEKAIDKFEYVPNEILVKLKQPLTIDEGTGKQGLTTQGIDPQELPPVLKKIDSLSKIQTIEPVFKPVPNTSNQIEMNKTSPSQPDLSRTYKLKVANDIDIKPLINELKTSDEVEYAEPNYFHKTFQTPSTSIPQPTSRPSQPNDPLYSNMWNLSKIKIEDAWQVTKGSKNVTVAVLDTGIDFTHSELGETKVTERSFDQITQEPLSLYFPSNSTRVSQTLALDGDRLAYYSHDKIYIYSFITKATTTIDLPSTAPDPGVIRLALKNDILVYAADYNQSDYYTKAQLYMYNLTTHEHKSIFDYGGNNNIFPFDLSDQKIVWTQGAHVGIYDIATGARSLQTNVNTFPFQYISDVKISGNFVAYSHHEIESPCNQALVIHNIDTNQRQRYYPPNIGPVMDFKDNKVLYRACYSDGGYDRVGFYLFDTTTGQSKELAYNSGTGATGGSMQTEAHITIIHSQWDEGVLGDGVVFFSEDTKGEGIVAFDTNSNSYVKISLLKAAYNFAAEGKRVCFVSSDSRIYCHTYNSSSPYPPPPASYFNERVVSGFNFVENNNNPIDRYGHGTHVAGTIGASVNNGLGVSGINWDVSLMAIKVLDNSGSGTTDTIARGIIYAADNGAKVINMSLGGSYPCSQSQTFQEAINYARGKGVAVVVAAGNSDTDASGFSPASCQGVITVGATGPTNERSSYSNYGSVVDLAAPGGDRSKCTDGTSCLINSTYPNNQYNLFQGTSMAAPHVSGLVGLMFAMKPSLIPEEVEVLLKENADSLTTDQPIGNLLNAFKTLNQLCPNGPCIPPTPTLTPVPPTITSAPLPTVPPNVGKALHLPFTSFNPPQKDYVLVHDPTARIQVRDTMTIELWALPEKDLDNSTILSKSGVPYGDENVTYSLGFINDQFAPNKSKPSMYFKTTTGSVTLISPDVVRDDGSTWTHIAVTKLDNTLKLFVNGVLKDTQTFTGSILDFPSSDLSFGAYLNPYDISTSYFGKIDDVRISNIVRDIPDSWTKGFYFSTLRADNSTMGLWRFEDSLRDETRNNLHGEKVGNPTFSSGRVPSPATTPTLTPTITPTVLTASFNGQTTDKVSNWDVKPDGMKDISFTVKNVQNDNISVLDIRDDQGGIWVGRYNKGTWTHNGTNYIAYAEGTPGTKTININTIPANVGNRTFTITLINPDGTRKQVTTSATITYTAPSPTPTTQPDTLGVYRPSNSAFYLRDQLESGKATTQFAYGASNDKPVVGDWDKDGIDSAGIFRGGLFFLRNSNTAGTANVSFSFGTSGDLPIVGDWDGDGRDTVAVYRNGTFYLKNTLTGGTADTVFTFGITGDIPVAGDWNGDGKDTVGVYRPSNNTFYLRNSNTSGPAESVFNYGVKGDIPVIGDWNNDRTDTIAVYRKGIYYIRNSNTSGQAEKTISYGISDDIPLAGKWK